MTQEFQSRIIELTDSVLSESITTDALIRLMNDLDNPFSYNLLPGRLLKIPNSVDHIINLVQRNKTDK